MKLSVRLLECSGQFDKLYTYLAGSEPAESGPGIVRGTFVMVPFGLGNRKAEAVVCEIPPDDREEKYRLKEIIFVSDADPLDAREMELCLKLKDYYACTLGDAVRCVRPMRKKPKSYAQYINLSKSPEETRAVIEGNTLRSIYQIKVLNQLLDAGGRLLKEEISIGLQQAPEAIRALIKKGLVYAENAPEEHVKDILPSKDLRLPTYAQHTLTESQQKVFGEVSAAIERRDGSEFLLHGVTGSGKTELYMQWIRAVIERGGKAIMLVPEIALTPQMISHFTARFGSRVAVLHSGLSDALRLKEWERVRSGLADVVIGARSGIFAPFPDIDLIIMDEAHDSSYRCDEGGLRYSTADVARMRAGGKTVIIYGTATPETEMYRHALDGDIKLLTLTERPGGAELPKITVADMRDERRGMISGEIFGPTLYNALRENYESGHQAILYIGHRGYASTVVCRECGRMMKCGSCNLPMTYHEAAGRLICHHCGNTVKAPTACPVCGAKNPERYGTGTEKVQKELERLFPGAETVRIDSDTASNAKELTKALKRFSDGTAKFLVGTQMVTKGHDFPDVALVGVVNADAMLGRPEFRATEKTYQQLTQVSGRAGRGKVRGKVIIQAYDVDNYAISAAKDGNYKEFYKNEIEIRRNLVYPPFCTMLRIMLTAEDDREGYFYFKKTAAFLKSVAQTGTDVIGPARAPVPKIGGRYRWQIVVKCPARSDALILLKAWQDWCLIKENAPKKAWTGFVFE